MRTTIIRELPARAEIWKDIYNSLKEAHVSERTATATANAAMGLPIEKVDGIINIYKYI